MKKCFVLLAGLAASAGCALSARSDPIADLEAAYRGTPHLGIARFVFDDLGGLSTDTLKTNAVPWKVLAAALVLAAEQREGAPVSHGTLREVLAGFGFLFPSEIENWDAPSAPPQTGMPLGLVSGTLSQSFPSVRLRVANLGCASCHSGPTYDRSGSPRPDLAWAGLPNTSLDLEAYVVRSDEGLRLAVSNPGRLMAAVGRLFPDTPPEERLTIEGRVLPALRERLARRSGGDRLLPYVIGSPGLINGPAAMKLQLGLLDPARLAPDAGFSAAPDFGGIALRSALLSDGCYAPPGRERFRRMDRTSVTPEHVRELADMTAVFAVPAFGVSPDTAYANRESARDIWAFLEAYRPPAFPGEVDRELAARGERIYRSECARCHGVYEDGPSPRRLASYPNRFVPVEKVGTDPERTKAITGNAAEALKATAFGGTLEPVRTDGYVAPRLSGLWATAPYLHNGSVPTLWHLLHPEERPARFWVGGHRLDFRRMGIDLRPGDEGDWVYPAGYRPWSKPFLYETAHRGRSNSGHLWGADLDEEEKRALLEYLKEL